MDRGEPVTPNESLVETAANIAGLPTELVSLLFATHEPAELDRLMTRSFGDCHDDLVLQSLVTLTNSFAHTLERYRRRRKLSPITLRCIECQERRARA